MLHYNPQHVSSSALLIFRRTDCIITVSGIVTLCKQPYSMPVESGLVTCDFHLIPKMKEPFRGIRFRTVPEILQAVDRSIRTINTTGAAKGILRLPYRWQRVVHNAGDYTEGQ